MIRVLFIISLLLADALRAQDNSLYLRFEWNGERQLAPLQTGVHRSGNTLELEVRDSLMRGYIVRHVVIRNTGRDTGILRNVLPLGADSSVPRITGLGQHPLSRTHLFLPGKQPVNVICPDNAWELGFSSIPLAGGRARASLSRRDQSSVRMGVRRRFETVLYPGGSVRYTVWSTTVDGSWQDALRLYFQQEKLFDTDSISTEMYSRKDLQWIRNAYVMHLFMAWDKDVYDADAGRYTLADAVRRNRSLYGGDDVVCIWPTWPTLGMDPRNQFDLYRDLPGGLPALKRLSDSLHSLGTRFFMAYNPWDESTRGEAHLEGLTRLIRETGADGVVLDTRGASSRELQEAADKARPGVIMYSEGMAVPRDMGSIVAGRVHNALYYPPMLNLNKFIQPSFAIFRVAERYKEPVDREISLAFFNGYGTEFNVFAPGNPEWSDRQYRYLGSTTRILRENSGVFAEGRMTPLVDIMADSTWANAWTLPGKTIYTIYSTIPAGQRRKLLPVSPRQGWHFVDLWHHKTLEPVMIRGQWMAEVETAAFDSSWLGSNREGSVDCIAHLPQHIHVERDGDSILIRAPRGMRLLIWKGVPAYDHQPIDIPSGDTALSWRGLFGWYEGRAVIQLMGEGSLFDEMVLNLDAGTPRKISAPVKTPAMRGSTAGMARIPAGRFRFRTTHGDNFIPYPRDGEDSIMQFHAFYMDIHPVTNDQFQAFLKATRYRPKDTSGFLRHWVRGAYPAGQGSFPVTHVSYEDAMAYATWAGKRLPTEAEWQYAAQTTAGLEWPWKQEKPVTRKEEKVTETLTVFTLEGIDSSRCNLGTGKPYPVGSYPSGANPHGLQDLVGSVWQMTADLYQAGHYRYLILKGGSYFRPSSSWWYVQGGPRELHYRQMLLRVSPGFERNATIGFRCMRD